MRLRPFTCSLAVVLGAVLQVDACSVPVFRYALERWDPGRYELLIFHRGELSPESTKLHTSLHDRSNQMNLSVVLVDLDKENLREEWKGLWDRNGEGATAPRAMLRRVGAEPKEAPIWVGPFDKSSIAELTQSKARDEIAKRLCRGDSSVFVLLASGDAEADAAAEKMLQAKFKDMEKSLKLPPQDDTTPGPTVQSPIPLKIAFSMVKVDPKDPKEAMFVRSLRSGEPDLEKVKTPIVIPVFGRGRALAALYGELLSSDVIGEVGQFLCGDCTCTVKDLNPGWDLLFECDWNRLVFPEELGGDN